MQPSLNPWAKEFVPRKSLQAPKASPTSLVEPEPPFQLALLPTEVVARIASFLTHPQDLCDFLLASKQLLAAAQEAPTQIRLTSSQRNKYSNPLFASSLPGLVDCIVKYFPAATHLDLSGLPLETQQVRVLIQGLPHLQTLNLSNCKKLVPPLLSALVLGLPAAQGLPASTSSTISSSSSGGGGVMGSGVIPSTATTSASFDPSGSPSSSSSSGSSGSSGRKGGLGLSLAAARASSSTTAAAGSSSSTRRPAALQLQRLDLQRCYQLDSSCLSELLLLAAQPGSNLEALALSHLDLRFWPEPHQEQQQQQHEAGEGVAALAAGAAAGAAGVGAGGGSSSEDQQQQREGLRPATMQAGGLSSAALRGSFRSSLSNGSLSGGSSCCHLRVLALNNCAMLSPTGLLAVATSCPQLEFLFLGGSQVAPLAQQLEKELGWIPLGAAAATIGGGGSGEAVGSFGSPGGLLLGSVEGPHSLGSPAAGSLGMLAQQHAAAAAAAIGSGGGSGSSSREAAAAGVLRGLWTHMRQLQLELGLPEELPSCYLEEPAAGSSTAGGDTGAATGGTPVRTCSSSSSRRPRRAPRVLRLEDPTHVLRQSPISREAAKEARCQALCLAVVLQQLPRLAACELTFFHSHTVGWLRCIRDQQQLLLEQLRGTGSGGGLSAAAGAAAAGSLQRQRQQQEVLEPSSGRLACIWNLCTTDSLLAAMSFRQKAKTAEACSQQLHQQHQRSSSPTGNLFGLLHPQRQSAGAPGARGGGAGAGQLTSTESFALALRCSVNCSSKGRSTPLHAAADAGDAARCRLLIRAGASTAARDNSGASPLFLACEAGREAAVQVLLGAGADPLANNTAGETPLYIAALRGHVPVVRLLLGRLRALGVCWQDRSLYGDAWTPLMAAAVADRTDVALCLLQAAGGAAQELLGAANRYGQNVLHIAARKGSLGLLQLLLAYGGGLGVRVADACGDTPIDIARRFRHDGAVAEFTKVAVGA